MSTLFWFHCWLSFVLDVFARIIPMLMSGAKQLQALARLPGLPPPVQNLLKTMAPLLAITNETNIEEIMENNALMFALMQFSNSETQSLLDSKFLEFLSLNSYTKGLSLYF